MTNALASRQPDAKARPGPAAVPFTPRSIEPPPPQRHRAPEPESLLWQALVTLGHVRAARLRHYQPLISTIAVALIVLGFGLFLLLYRPVQHRPLEELIGQRRAVEQKRLAVVTRYFAPGMEVVQAAEKAGKQPKDFVQVEAVPTVIDELLKSLQAGKGLAAPTPAQLVKQAPEAFWKASWTAGQLGYVEGDDVYLVGTVVFGKFQEHPEPGYMRWLGLFRKSGGQWHYASLMTEDETPYEVPRHPSIAATDLPLTLSPLLPATTKGK